MFCGVGGVLWGGRCPVGWEVSCGVGGTLLGGCDSVRQGSCKRVRWGGW